MIKDFKEVKLLITKNERLPVITEQPFILLSCNNNCFLYFLLIVDTVVQDYFALTKSSWLRIVPSVETFKLYNFSSFDSLTL